MNEIVFGTQEHIEGLSRNALEEDFRWVNDRRMELEGECERLDAENAKLRELFSETLIRLAAANEAANCDFMDARYCELLESHGIKVGTNDRL